MRCLVFGSSANPELWEKVLLHFKDEERGKMNPISFMDGEVNPKFLSNLRGQEVVLLASRGLHDVNRDKEEIRLMIDAARRASAKAIHVVFSYMPSARNDHRREAERTAVGARAFLRDLELAGASHFMVVEPHSKQLTGMCDAPLDALHPRPVMLKALLARPEVQRAQGEGRLVIASPDAGGVQRATAYLRQFEGARMAFAIKERLGPNQSKAGEVVGNVKNCYIIIIDDIFDTAGTLTDAAQAFMEAGASGVAGLGLHPVLSGPAIERISKSPIEWLIVSNSVPLSEAARGCRKILPPICLGKFLANAIIKAVTGGSVSQLNDR